MSRAVISLHGNIAEPQVKTMPDGTDVVSFGLATNAYSKNGDITSWWRVSIFGKRCKGLITLMNKGMFGKGSNVAVVGEVTQRPYIAKDGTERMSMDVRAYEADVLFAPKGQQDNVANIAEYQGSQDIDQLPF